MSIESLVMNALGMGTPVAPPGGPVGAPKLPQHPQVTPAVQAAYEALLAAREGRRNVVYRDSLGKPTVGIGHLVLPQDHMVVGQKITDAQVDALFAADGKSAMDAALAQAEQAGIAVPAFLPYLASVCFQLGNAWTKKFPNTWKMVCSGQYEAAAQALEDTAWNEQTPSRVQDFQKALRALPKK